MNRNDIYTIEATLISQTDKSWYLDCEGDKVHFPKSIVEFDADKEELKAPLWLLQEKFPETKF
jgi:hypothetical protein